jgi:hypothetical protein
MAPQQETRRDREALFGGHGLQRVVAFRGMLSVINMSEVESFFEVSRWGCSGQKFSFVLCNRPRA